LLKHLFQQRIIDFPVAETPVSATSCQIFPVAETPVSATRQQFLPWLKHLFQQRIVHFSGYISFWSSEQYLPLLIATPQLYFTLFGEKLFSMELF